MTIDRRILPLCCCAALIGAALAGPAAFAQRCARPGHHTAATCHIDSDGCEWLFGAGTINDCNSPSRADGSVLLIEHRISNWAVPVTSDFFAFGNGASTYATLWCSNNSATAIFRGEIAQGQSKLCDENQWPQAFSFRSVCGPKPICGNK